VAEVEGVTAFLVVAVVVIVTPGPDTALTIRNTLLGGRRSGISTALGVAAGQATWTLATSAGVAALLVASEPVFRVLKLVGAAYLVVLGLQALRLAFRRDRTADDASRVAVTGPRLRPAVALRQGVFSNLSNPKMAAFFPALLPQFAPPGDAAFGGLLLLGLSFSLMTLAWLSAYAVAVARAGDLLRRPRVRRALEAATGAALFALGLRLAADARR
jgi:threonine/homoserine/homoserine lactone efflux protein